MNTRHISLIWLAALACGCAAKGPESATVTPHPSPDFSLRTLDGQSFSLAALHGKVVVLDFWATWCPPCRESLPHLQAMASNSDMSLRGLAVFAVNEREKTSTVNEFLAQSHYALRVAEDGDGSLARDFEVTSLPTTIVIGRDGVIQASVTGWTPESAQLIDDAVAHALEAAVR